MTYQSRHRRGGGQTAGAAGIYAPACGCFTNNSHSLIHMLGLCRLPHFRRRCKTKHDSRSSDYELQYTFIDRRNMKFSGNLNAGTLNSIYRGELSNRGTLTSQQSSGSKPRPSKTMVTFQGGFIQTCEDRPLPRSLSKASMDMGSSGTASGTGSHAGSTTDSRSGTGSSGKASLGLSTLSIPEHETVTNEVGFLCTPAEISKRVSCIEDSDTFLHNVRPPEDNDNNDNSQDGETTDTTIKDVNANCDAEVAEINESQNTSGSRDSSRDTRDTHEAQAGSNWHLRAAYTNDEDNTNNNDNADTCDNTPESNPVKKVDFENCDPATFQKQIQEVYVIKTARSDHNISHMKPAQSMRCIGSHSENITKNIAPALSQARSHVNLRQRTVSTASPTRNSDDRPTLHRSASVEPSVFKAACSAQNAAVVKRHSGIFSGGGGKRSSGAFSYRGSGAFVQDDSGVFSRMELSPVGEKAHTHTPQQKLVRSSSRTSLTGTKGGTSTFRKLKLTMKRKKKRNSHNHKVLAGTAKPGEIAQCKKATIHQVTTILATSKKCPISRS